MQCLEFLIQEAAVQYIIDKKIDGAGAEKYEPLIYHLYLCYDYQYAWTADWNINDWRGKATM